MEDVIKDGYGYGDGDGSGYGDGDGDGDGYGEQTKGGMKNENRS